MPLAALPLGRRSKKRLNHEGPAPKGLRPGGHKGHEKRKRAVAAEPRPVRLRSPQVRGSGAVGTPKRLRSLMRSTKVIGEAPRHSGEPGAPVEAKIPSLGRPG